MPPRPPPQHLSKHQQRSISAYQRDPWATQQRPLATPPPHVPHPPDRSLPPLATYQPPLSNVLPPIDQRRASFSSTPASSRSSSSQGRQPKPYFSPGALHPSRLRSEPPHSPHLTLTPPLSSPSAHDDLAHYSIWREDRLEPRNFRPHHQALPLPLSPVQPRPVSSPWLPPPPHVLAPIRMDSSGSAGSSSNRKRKDDDREGSRGTPESVSSASGSALLVTPKSDLPEPPLKRRGSATLEQMLLKGTPSDKPDLNFDFSSPSSLFPQRLVAFPAQVDWPPAEGTNSANANSHERPITDPATSSVRSTGDNQDNELPPELHFTAETLDTLANEVKLDDPMLSLANASDAQSNDGLRVPDEGKSKDQPFSRSPELRISHKLAERKRRKEMKDLFDELHNLLPADRGSKSSKWEVLSKAIDYITLLKGQNSDMAREIDKLRRDLDIARGGNGQYQAPYAATYGLGPASIGVYPTANTFGQGTPTAAPAAGTSTAQTSPSRQTPQQPSQTLQQAQSSPSQPATGAAASSST